MGYPDPKNVLAGSGAFGSANESTPTLTLPAAASVLTGTSFGTAGANTGTYDTTSVYNAGAAAGAAEEMAALLPGGKLPAPRVPAWYD